MTRPTPSPQSKPPLSRQILIVDDNKTVADMMHMMVSLCGYNAARTYDATSALMLLDQFRPDTVLVDLKMPGMDGLTLVRKLRSHPVAANALIALITGHDGEDTRRAARNAGADEVLCKPLSIKSLFTLLGEQVAQRGFY